MQINNLAELIESGKDFEISPVKARPLGSGVFSIEELCPHCYAKILSVEQKDHTTVESVFYKDEFHSFDAEAIYLKPNLQNRVQGTIQFGVCLGCCSEDYVESLSAIIIDRSFDFIEPEDENELVINFLDEAIQSYKAIDLFEIKILDMPVGYCTFYHQVRLSPMGIAQMKKEETRDLISTFTFFGKSSGSPNLKNTIYQLVIEKLVLDCEAEFDKWIEFLKLDADYYK